jgi:hypothetical protein
VTGGWRKLHNEENHMGRACNTNGGRRGMYIEYWWERQKERDHWDTKMYVGGQYRMDLREIGWDGMD